MSSGRQAKKSYPVISSTLSIVVAILSIPSLVGELGIMKAIPVGGLLNGARITLKKRFGTETREAPIVSGMWSVSIGPAIIINALSLSAHWRHLVSNVLQRPELMEWSCGHILVR